MKQNKAHISELEDFSQLLTLIDQPFPKGTPREVKTFVRTFRELLVLFIANKRKLKLALDHLDTTEAVTYGVSFNNHVDELNAKLGELREALARQHFN
ncbi:MAG: hypothetical protein M1358_06300 [Chloroflexi bacterium]|nr:hypothetical protein [Chloroflexota bacterium]